MKFPLACFVYSTSCFKLILFVLPIAFLIENFFLFSYYLHLSTFHIYHVFQLKYFCVSHGMSSEEIDMGSVLLFCVFFYELSMFQSSLLLFIVKYENPIFFATCFWVDSEQSLIVSIFYKTNPQSNFEVEPMVSVLWYIKWFQSKKRHLKKLTEKLVLE